MEKGIFITATDTGVGKTFIAAGIAKEMMKMGIDVAYYKPFSSGGPKSRDLQCISSTVKCPIYNTYHFEPPLAPYPASKIPNPNSQIPTMNKIQFDFKIIQKKHKFVIVDGIGGVLVPITKNIFVADLIKKLNIPAVVVAKAGIGTINHTLLTIEALKKRKVTIMGIILNGFKGKDISEKTNAEIIEELSGITILEKVMWYQKKSDFSRRFITNPHKYDLIAKRMLNA